MPLPIGDLYWVPVPRGGQGVQPHAGPRAGAPRAGLEAEAGVRGDPRPEPLLGSVCESDEPLLGCLGCLAWV